MRAYVRVRVGAESYAMPVESVLEVAVTGEVTPVPGSRAEVLGVRSLRGQLLPVIDLGALLGCRGGAPAARLVVAEAGHLRAGFAVDEISDVARLPDPAEEPDSRLLRGGLLDGDDLVGVIDVPALFEALERGRPGEHS